jgi:hypothetical protein
VFVRPEKKKEKDCRARTMGRDKKSNRTKDQPSSSARAAAAAASSGEMAMTGLGSAGSLTGLLLPPSSSTLSPELHVLLRKLYKPSAVTKVKALDELRAVFGAEGALADEREAEAAVAAVAQLLMRLATDPDRPVRERAGAMLSALVALPTVRHCLGRHVRGLVPAWLLLMADPARDVAASATAAFEAIPEAGRAKAIAASRAEIVT